MPHYNVMGVAKAALEASVRYLAVDLGPGTSASMRSRPARSRRWQPRDRRFPLHPQMERIQRAAQAHRFHRRGRRFGGSIWCPTWRAASPARCITSIAGYHVVGMKAVDAPDIAAVLKE
jgi:enoyl-[acyl-carrier protein] reductase I